jgi:hypothetical protein
MRSLMQSGLLRVLAAFLPAESSAWPGRFSEEYHTVVDNSVFSPILFRVDPKKI